MSRRHRSSSYNAIPQAIIPPAPAPEPVPTPAVSPVRSLLSLITPTKSASPIPFSLPALPVGDIVGGVSNTVRGLVLNDNWWLLLLIIFLFFPKISGKMFGGLFKD
ncbi:MAG TPA: hypothetical protein VEB00_07960 [Clostridia bacterium]|nr:hypothetical protein [Clostridia bacterium]